MVDVVVVGAGLAGLTASDALHRAGLSVTVVEARASVGGRIRTIVDGAGWLDLGATWHWSNQPEIASLADELGVESFPQFREGRAMVEESAGTAARAVDLPRPTPAELRFAGGAQSLCHELAARLPEGTVIQSRVGAETADASARDERSRATHVCGSPTASSSRSRT